MVAIEEVLGRFSRVVADAESLGIPLQQSEDSVLFDFADVAHENCELVSAHLVDAAVRSEP